jgi:hypothetical protein
VLAFALVFSESSACQIDTAVVPPEKDLSDLHRRAAASRFVVIGTVIKAEGVGRHLSESDKQKMSQPSADGKTAIVLLPTLGGSLYTIRIEKTVCRQEEFRIIPAHDGRLSADSDQTAYLFVPRTGPMFEGGHPQEILQLGERYMLFLYEPAREKQQEWTKSFELDPKRVYYRGEELSRGVIPLAKPSAENPRPEQPPVLEKVTRLCEAMQPTDLVDKLAGLKSLENSGDPILAKEAEAAAKALAKQAAQRSPSRQ